jgi:DNA-binding IclR family transcriptional regulator
MQELTTDTRLRPAKANLRERILAAISLVYDASGQRVSLNGRQLGKWLDEPVSTVNAYLQMMEDEGLAIRDDGAWLPTNQGRAYLANHRAMSYKQ